MEALPFYSLSINSLTPCLSSYKINKNMGFFDAFRKRSDPISNGERMRKIRESGKDGEEQFRRDNVFSNIERKHHGRDFDEHQKDWTGKTVKKIPWEVKKNNSPLSPKQKKTKNLHVRRYIATPYGNESHTEDKHGNKLEHNMFTGKWEKIKKEKTSSFSLFGSNSDTKKKNSSKKKSDSIFGSSSMDSLFGSSTKKKTTKKRSSKKKSDSIFGSSSTDSIFGSSSSTKKKTTNKSPPKKKQTSIWGSSSKSKKNTGIW